MQEAVISCIGGAMGKEDIRLKNYLEDARRYADLWNGSVFKGKQILKVGELKEVSPVLSRTGEGSVLERIRDFVMMESCAGQCFAVYTVENQKNIDYSMPARIMLQEALEYDRQIRTIMRENRKRDEEYQAGRGSKIFQNVDERMYRIRRSDKLYPIATLVIYWGEQEWNGPKSLHEMIAFHDKGTVLGSEFRKLVPEYPLHFLDLTNFQHFEYFKTELRPLLELYQKRNSKEKFLEYMNDSEKYKDMDEESWYLLSQLTNSKSIRNLIQRREQEEREEGSMCKALDDLIADGKAEGKAEAIIELLEEHGDVPNELRNRIFTPNDLLLLSQWHKIAAHVSSVEEFVCQIDH